jgi:hypothetical protein
MNRREVRMVEFANHKEWAERFDSDTLRKKLAEKKAGWGAATAIREVLRDRSEPLNLPDFDSEGGG